MINVGGDELRRLYGANLGQYVAGQLDGYETMRDTHVNGGQGVCAECGRVWGTNGCEQHQEAVNKIEYWRNYALSSMPPQPGDGPGVRR